jgi:hypothetical protein
MRAAIDEGCAELEVGLVVEPTPEDPGPHAEPFEEKNVADWARHSSLGEMSGLPFLGSPGRRHG